MITETKVLMYFEKNNFYMCLALCDQMDYQLYSLDISISNDSKKYFYCKNKEGDFINENGVYETFEEILNNSDIKSTIPLEKFKENEENYRAFTNMSFQVEEKANGKIKGSFVKCGNYDRDYFSECVKCALNNIQSYTSDKNIKYTSKDFLLKNEPEDFVQREHFIRLLYMSGDKVCTVIDVDESSREIIIENFTDDLYKRAFGRDEKPSWDRYWDFLEDRCRLQRKIGKELFMKKYNLDYYHPIEVALRTQGRVWEDNQWIMVFERAKESKE